MYAPHTQKFSKSYLNKDIQIALSTNFYRKDTYWRKCPTDSYQWEGQHRSLDTSDLSISLQSVRISTTDIKGERPLEANRNKDLMIILDNSDMISAG